MTTELTLLKHIPCPKGDSCTSLRCLFRHKEDDEKDLKAIGEKAISEGVDQDGPRKRVKTGSDEYDPAALPSITPPAPVATPAPPAPAATKLHRPVSPPPLKRKADAISSPARKPATPAKQEQQPGKASPAPSTGASPAAPPKPARKPETLNPRHIGAAPAPHDTRLKLLKLLHEQYARLNGQLKKDASDDEEKLVLSEQGLVWLALDDEEDLAKSKAAIYANMIKNRIVAHKRMSAAEWKSGRQAVWDATHRRSTTDEAAAQSTKTSIHPVEIKTGLSPELELEVASSRLRTPIDDKAEFGYVPAVPSTDDIQLAREADDMNKGWEKCDRCDTRFQVFPGRREADGALASGGACTHHWGRTYYPPRPVGGERSVGDRTRHYRCCGQAVGDSPGCATAESHVFKVTDAKRLALVWNFAETPPNPAAPADRAVCFDCEMAYTVRGLELVRLTATSWPRGDLLLDVLVRPHGEILDLNSRFSGVYPEDLARAVPFTPAPASPLPPLPFTPALDDDTTTTEPRPILPIVSSPEAARALLFALISPETPLVGHGLENDLNCTRIVHPVLIDTVLLFPHHKPLPLRHGLRHLAQLHLGRLIQVGDAGHDSAEDARAAGDLVRIKVRDEWEKMRREGWTVDAEAKRLVAPGRLTEAFLEGHGKGDEVEDGEVKG